jgi:hypothetical protein
LYGLNLKKSHTAQTMNAAKVQLSSAEMTLVCDPAWILTKNAIMTKVVALLAALSERYVEVYAPLTGEGGLPPTQPPKISKGENYRGLPYVMLDYPRIFGKEDVFAIRTMFWWGHYFSVTLHLKGIYKEIYGPVIARHIQQTDAPTDGLTDAPTDGLTDGLREGIAGRSGAGSRGRLLTSGFHLGISEEEWRHELAADNYTSLEAAAPIVIGKTLREHPFLKLSATCGIDRWDEAPEELLRLFETLVNVVNSAKGEINFPGGEINP